MSEASLFLMRSAARLSIGRCVMAAYGIVLLALLIHFGLYFEYAIRAVRYPFQLDYGEGIVWQQALLMPGPSMYGDITHYPYTVFHYPPLYHLLVRGLAALGGDMLEMGRAVSLVCTLLTGVLIAALTNDVIGTNADRAARLTGAAIAGLSVFCFYPIVFWSPYMRVDMLAAMLGYLGLWLAGRSATRPWLLYAAVLAFVLSLYAKQNGIMAPLAVLLVSLASRPRLTLRAFGIGAAIGLIALAVLMAATDGRFLRHLVLYNLMNRFVPGLALSQFMHDTLPHAIFLVMTIAGIAAAWRWIAASAGGGGWLIRWSRIAADPSSRLMVMVLLYLAFTTMTLVGLGKSGSAKNYFIGWMSCWSVMIGVLVASTFRRSPDADAAGGSPLTVLMRFASPMLFPAVLLMQIVILPASRDYGGDDPVVTRELQDLVTEIRRNDKPVVSDDMVLLMRAGKRVPLEPTIFADLASMGVWDETPFVDMISAGAFAFIIREGRPGQLIYESRTTPAIEAAMARAYPRIEERGGLMLHLPP
jgi:hypothetical protein